MKEKTIVATRCVILSYEGKVKVYAFPGTYRYRLFERDGNTTGQLFINGNWRAFQPGEEVFFREI